MTRRTSILSTRVTRLTRVAFACLLVAVTLGGCASHAARCDGALQPINAPAAVEHRTPGGTAGHDGGAP